MRIGIVVDSACDLPVEYLQAQGIVILPITAHLGSQDFIDRRDPEATLQFYRKHLGVADDGGTTAFTAAQIRQLFLGSLVLDYDFVFCLTIASSRSPIFANAEAATAAIMQDSKSVRAGANIPGPFAMRVMDSGNLFAAQGVIAVEAARMVKARENPNRIRDHLEFLGTHTYGYLLPNDLYYIRTRAKKKGDKSVGLLQYAVARALDIKPVLRAHRNRTTAVARLRRFDEGAGKCFGFLIERMRAGLLSKTVCLSYGGDLAEMRGLPGYAAFKSAAEELGIEVFESIMSITGGINVGEGALMFAFAAEPHEFRA